MRSSKRFKRGATVLECLPNELFVEIFQFLSGVDAVCAFGQLNRRFRSITRSYCDSFDFASISKGKLNNVIRCHDVHRWKSLRLSDNYQTYGQVSYFNEFFSWSKDFSELQRLSITHMKPQFSEVRFSEFNTLVHLVSLSLGSVCGKNLPILELPALKYLQIQSCLHCHWMQKLNRLESLHHTIEHPCAHEQALTWPSSLRRLFLSLDKPEYHAIVRTSLSTLSELTDLSIYESAWDGPPPNGQLWEALIVASLPLLERFRCCFKFWRDASPAGDVDQILGSFATPFYLQEKGWFFQCDINHLHSSKAMLYSIPFAFKHFHIVTQAFDNSVWTSRNPAEQKTSPTAIKYSKVQALSIDITCDALDPGLNPSQITDLTIGWLNGPVKWLFSMASLRRLTLTNKIVLTSDDFASLLENSPHLDSLTTPYQRLRDLTNEWKNSKVCRELSAKIRSLTITADGYLTYTGQHYVAIEDLAYIMKIFHRHCQHLVITVHSRNLIAGVIIKEMHHLRSLQVRLHEHGEEPVTKQWLNEQYPRLNDLNYTMMVHHNEYSFWFDMRQ